MKIAKEYKSIPLTFSHYYKYSFTFTGVADNGKKIHLSIGGAPAEIYRLEVSSDSVLYLKDLDLMNFDVYEENDSLIVIQSI